jgi:hypothetical protein
LTSYAAADDHNASTRCSLDQHAAEFRRRGDHRQASGGHVDPAPAGLLARPFVDLFQVNDELTMPQDAHQPS